MGSAASSFAKLAITAYKKSHATPLAAFFKAGKALGVSVKVQGLGEAQWKVLQKRNMETVFDKLDRAIKVTAGKELIVFDWTDIGKIAVRNARKAK